MSHRLLWVAVVAGTIGAVLMYVFTRELFGDRDTALFAAVLYLFVPARLLFFPLMNTITPVVVLTCACLLLRWLRFASPAYAVLLGVALFGLVLFEPLVLVIGLLFAPPPREESRSETSGGTDSCCTAHWTAVFIVLCSSILQGALGTSMIRFVVP
jgi:hypothetical protein